MIIGLLGVSGSGQLPTTYRGGCLLALFDKSILDEPVG